MNEISQLSTEAVDKIVNSCIKCFNRLPKSGKPVEEEWTVLSCIVQYNLTNDETYVVSLGTGSKCIGASKLSPAGNLLNDSHAEVIARRGFLLYLYDQIEKAIDKKDSIFEIHNFKFKLKPNIYFIFYSSQLPCGDASIIPTIGEEDLFGEVVKSQKRCAEDNICDLEDKKIKYNEDIHRTGAKCLPGAEQDPQGPGVDYHILGQVRTKPGRGDRTLSVSCSDKIARWIHVGIQGALLDLLILEPIYIAHYVFGAGVPYSKESLERAFLKRTSNNSTEVVPPLIPYFYQSTVMFQHIKKHGDTLCTRPAPGSIIWAKTSNNLIEVSILGRKLGVVMKKIHLRSNAICITKVKLYERFISVLKKCDHIAKDLLNGENIENVPYNTMKQKSIKYYSNWTRVKDNFFKIWTVKPKMWNFCIN